MKQISKQTLLEQIVYLIIWIFIGVAPIVSTPDFITFLRHHMAHIENQLITSNNWVVLGGASEKHVPL